MKIEISKILEFLNKNFETTFLNVTNLDIEVEGFSPIDDSKKDTIAWSNQSKLNCSDIKSALVIGKKGLVVEGDVNFLIVIVDNPRLAFAKISEKFFKLRRTVAINSTARIHETATILEGVSIGPYCIINENVSIGARTIIEGHVVIERDVIIGADCYVKSGTVIGQDGFSVARDNDNSLVRILHTGAVNIGNRVEIGSMNTLNRGTLKDTLIADGVKIDDHVHIAHNCSIGKNTVITAGTTICGSVTINENVWLGAQSIIIDGVTIAENTIVGVGSVVMRNTKPNSSYMGNPARKLKNA